MPGVGDPGAGCGAAITGFGALAGADVPGAGAGDGVDEPGGVDLADPAVVGVGDDEVALGVDANVLGGVESAAQRGATIGGVRAVGAGNHVLLRRDAREGVDLSVRGLDLADDAPAGVGDEHVAGGVDGDPVRRPQEDTAWVGALGAVVGGAEGGAPGEGAHDAAGVDLAHHVVAGVGDVGVAVRVEGDAAGAAVAEVGLQPVAAVAEVGVVGAEADRARARVRARHAGRGQFLDAVVGADVEVPRAVERLRAGEEELGLQERADVADASAGDGVDDGRACSRRRRGLGRRRCRVRADGRAVGRGDRGGPWRVLGEQRGRRLDGGHRGARGAVRGGSAGGCAPRRRGGDRSGREGGGEHGERGDGKGQTLRHTGPAGMPS